MPLILLTGLPCSGKTHRAQQILTDFQSRISSVLSETLSHVPNGLSIQYLPSFHASLDLLHGSDQNLASIGSISNPRDLIYTSAREEKIARAEEFSAIKRALSKNNIVISDAPNYIKGFRYQLWCEAKAAGTRCVVVHAAAREDECRAWNKDRIAARGWEGSPNNNNEEKVQLESAKLGGDVPGELQPESHTAIYGDRPVNDIMLAGTRSSTSSMNGDISDDDGTDTKKDIVDTTTLKSLYISERKPDSQPDDKKQFDGHESTLRGPTHEIATAATLNPPLPKASLPYMLSTFQSLSMRYEPPSPFTRWDTPLFTVPSSDAHPPYQAIWDAIFPQPIKPTKKTVSQHHSGEATSTKPEEVRRHAATVLPKASGSEALQILESATADVVKAFLAAARDSGAADGGGGNVKFSIPDAKSGVQVQVEIDVPLNTMLSQPALQRLRRKYTQIQRGGIAHGQGYVSGRIEIVDDFSRFLETEWNTDQYHTAAQGQWFETKVAGARALIKTLHGCCRTIFLNSGQVRNTSAKLKKTANAFMLDPHLSLRFEADSNDMFCLLQRLFRQPDIGLDANKVQLKESGHNTRTRGAVRRVLRHTRIIGRTRVHARY